MVALSLLLAFCAITLVAPTLQQRGVSSVRDVDPLNTFRVRKDGSIESFEPRHPARVIRATPLPPLLYRQSHPASEYYGDLPVDGGYGNKALNLGIAPSGPRLR